MFLDELNIIDKQHTKTYLPIGVLLPIKNRLPLKIACLTTKINSTI